MSTGKEVNGLKLEKAKTDFDRKPHQCPNCNGLGTKACSSTSIPKFSVTSCRVTCMSCDGKGVVWQ